MRLMKMTLTYVEQRNGQWWVIGRGHHYNPEGEVYLWPDGVWSSAAAHYNSKEEAENKLEEWRKTGQPET